MKRVGLGRAVACYGVFFALGGHLACGDSDGSSNQEVGGGAGSPSESIPEAGAEAGGSSAGTPTTSAGDSNSAGRGGTDAVAGGGAESVAGSPDPGGAGAGGAGGETGDGGEAGAGGSCDGLCCGLGASCSCPRPSAGNLLTNAGFDSNIAGWNAADGGSEVFSWASESTSGRACPFSGTLRLNTTAQAGLSTSQFYQCVNIDPSSIKTYYFGAAMRNGDNAGNDKCTLGECYLQWTSGGCFASEGSATITLQSSTAGWVDAPKGPLTRPAGANGARVGCLIRSGAIGAKCVFAFDNLSLTEAPDKY